MLDSGNKIMDYLYRDERDSLTLHHRFYVIGKLVRQDLIDPEPGFRETLCCKLCKTAMQIIGPNHFTEDRWVARCMNDKCKASRYRYYARTVIELWKAINPQGE